ncbi:MAG: hypothetical protein Q8Q13_03205 [bacterium]|nr:hypothetical protein [bacterium]
MKQAIDEISKNAAPHRDRWHYLDFSEDKHKYAYFEWKYLNFIQGDMAGYIMYIVIDPEHKTSIGSGRLMARVYQGGKYHGGVIKVPMEKIQFDTSTASVTMDRARLDEKTPHNYVITGDVNNVSWNLEYLQSTQTIESFQKTNFGIMPWENSSWLVKMPRARVAGLISINGGEIPITAIGYTDTNWGEWLPLFSRYDWGQFNDENISVAFLLAYKWGRISQSFVYVEINHEVIVFESPTLRMLERKWGTDGITHIRMPTTSSFEITGGPYTLNCSYAPIFTDMIAVKVSSLLPKPCVAEQVSRFNGTLKKNGKTIYSFSGLGFSEHNINTWKNTEVTL